MNLATTTLYIAENLRCQVSKKFKAEAIVFFGVFLLIFSSIKLQNVGFLDSVEQWNNLTNSMFYGEQDFLFSYGPLYWIVGGAATQFDYSAYWMTMVFVSAVNGLFWAILFPLIRQYSSLVLFGIAYYLLYKYNAYTTAVYLLPFAFLVRMTYCTSFYDRVGNRYLAIFAILAAGFLFIRFFYGLVTLASFGSYLLLQAVTIKSFRSLIRFCIFVFVAYVGFGLFLFHDWYSLFDYLLVNKNLSFGNSVDMTLGVRNTNLTFVLCGCIAVIANIFYLARLPSLVLTFNIIMLLSFKLGFSRTDHYFPYYVIPMAILVLPMLFDKYWWPKIAYSCVIASLFYMSIRPIYPGAPIKVDYSTTSNFSVPFEVRMSDMYRGYRLDDSLVKMVGASSIDIYPYNNEYAFANNLNYWHRPSFQNYMTLTPPLDEMNLKFLTSKRGPEFILWTAAVTCTAANCSVFDDLDGKYVLSEDPLTSSAILLNYHPVKFSSGKNGAPVVLLKRNDDIVSVSSSPIARMTMRFGEWYAVPPNVQGVTKLVPEFSFTLLGRFKNLIFRGGVVKVRYRLVSGLEYEYRLNILNAGSGIWINPLVRNLDLSGDAVESVMLSTDSDNYIQPSFEVNWVSLPIASKTAPVHFNVVSTGVPELSKATSVSCDGVIDSINGLAPGAADFRGRTAMQINGWLAKSTQEGSLFDTIYLVLKDASGSSSLISVDAQSRPDVGSAFAKPQLSGAGYRALVDASKLSGDYKLGLAGMSDGKFFQCGAIEFPIHLGPLR